MAEIVDSTLANECIAEYDKTYNSNDPALIQQAYTESVSFPLTSAIKFLQAAVTTADTFTIKFGVYTQDFADKYGVQAGRLTVFLCTTKQLGGGVGDPPNDVYNVGESQP